MTQLVSGLHRYITIPIVHCGGNRVGDTQHMTHWTQRKHIIIPIVHCGGNRVCDTQHITQLDLEWRGYIISPIVHSIGNME